MIPYAIAGIRKKRTPSEWFGYVVAQVIETALRTWVVMLLLGWVHHDLFATVPALGYWQTLGGLFLLDYVLTSTISSAVKMAIREEIQ